MSLGTGTDPNRFATKLFNGLPRRYDRLGYLLSMGQDRRWRAAIVDKVKARQGDAVLDVATGTAGVALALRAATGAEITGIDLNANMLETARQKLAQRGESGIRLVQGRAEDLPFADDSFDDVTFTYLLRYVRTLRRRWPSWFSLEARRRSGRHGLLRACVSSVVPAVVVLHALGVTAGGTAHRRTRVDDVGRFLGPNIEGQMTASLTGDDDRVLEGRRGWSTSTRSPCRSVAVSSCGGPRGAVTKSLEGPAFSRDRSAKCVARRARGAPSAVYGLASFVRRARRDDRAARQLDDAHRHAHRVFPRGRCRSPRPG